MNSKRYTLSLPSEIYEELRLQAEKHDRSIKEVVRQCLKFGLVAMKVDESSNSDIFIKEHIGTENGTDIETRETRIQFVW